MFSLFKGDCESCGRSYNYSLVNAVFADCSYAYCDTCGRLAIISYANGFLLQMPPISTENHVIDTAWEQYLRPCACGGRFRREASPRCPFCVAPLSAKYAAAHIDKNHISGGRGWNWQRNWTDSFCIDIEDPTRPGEARMVTDPFLDSKTRSEIEQAEKPGLLERVFKSRA
ncbi:MAG TPA: hypothetical protein VN151_03545 [Terracidiphilus sp.]|nr:hypothetical protein [Terracidiphilus sp.]